MPFSNQNTFSIYEAADTYRRFWTLHAAYFCHMATLLDERENFPLIAQQLSQVPPLGRMRRITAMGYKALHRITQCYDKPEFGIDTVEVTGQMVPVEEIIVFEVPFCRLLYFRKQTRLAGPRLLLVAPMAGHYSTLLRETVRDLLPYFDVYVTDWANARDVPMSDGGFDLNDYIDRVIDFTARLGPELHVMGICQAGVPLAAALALMEADETKADQLPKSLIVMGSPIDTRRSPTAVNILAAEKTENWFEDRMICTVPSTYPGAHRAVYPGFMQLLAFMSMNPQRHQKSLRDAARHYVEGNFDEEQKIDSFYNEFFSVMDLTAEFYMQTVQTVFQEQRFARGTMDSRGRQIDPVAIRRTPILAIEAENDDITGLGQTKALLELTTKLSDSRKGYYMLEEAGHYGLFNGHRFRQILIPEIRRFIAAQEDRSS